jgi:18S rRNA (adenine1779-N6/adenine1780-N6)-dimethyltransferase
MPKAPSNKRSHVGITAASSQPYGKRNDRSVTTAANTNLITPNTQMGQHFLKNPAVIAAIIQKAGVKSTDTVLEIGPGTGNMTVPLLQQSKNVVALEMDSRMVREVLKRVEHTDLSHKLKVIQGDAIRTKWPFFDLMVANLPYQISSSVVFKLLSHRPMFRCAVIMFQEEFALRLTARPGEALYCRLSVNTQLLAKVDQLLKVARNNFRPPPKVESRVVRIELKNPPPPVNFTEWDGMVRVFVLYRRLNTVNAADGLCSCIHLHLRAVMLVLTTFLFCCSVQIRLLFNRKNKTLRSVLNTKSVIKLLEENRKTVQALKNDGTAQAVPMDDGDDDDLKNKSVGDILEEITGREPWKGQRASKMDLDDFLQLLSEFNKAGIHFS